MQRQWIHIFCSKYFLVSSKSDYIESFRIKFRGQIYIWFFAQLVRFQNDISKNVDSVESFGFAADSIYLSLLYHVILLKLNKKSEKL